MNVGSKAWRRARRHQRRAIRRAVALAVMDDVITAHLKDVVIDRAFVQSSVYCWFARFTP
jgi:hypothetical protein